MKKVLIKFVPLLSVFMINSSFAEFISHLEMSVENESSYSINNISQVNDEHGTLLGLYANNVESTLTQEIASFEVNFLGQLSQDLSMDLIGADARKAGSCNIHIGIGSYIAKPDFTGSECLLNNGDYLQVNPRYEIVGGVYKLHYKFTKAKSFSRVIIFGDSMSDNGNLYQRSVELSLIFPISPILPVSPPYFKGRFTNGHVWVEQLSKKLNIPSEGVLDFAYGGASVKQDILPVPNLDKQVTKYLTWNKSSDPYALYVVWIGANDVLRNKSSESKVIEDILTGVDYNIRRLIDHGTKNLLVPQLPDISLAPDSIEKDQKNGNNSYTKRLQTIALGYNQKLRKHLVKLRSEFPGVNIMTFNVYEFLSEAQENADEYGFKYIDKRCNPNSYWGSDQAICKSPKKYVFWDGLHPSAKAHSILADLMYKVIAENGYEPNIRTIRQHLPDEFNLRNHQAIVELQKDIGNTGTNDLTKPKSGLRSQGYATGSDGFLETFRIVIDENIPMY